MIIVTGGAGFIGSNLVLGLNAKGHEDILVVDDLTDGTKFKNLVDAKLMDYWDVEEFASFIKEKKHIFREDRGRVSSGCLFGHNRMGRMLYDGIQLHLFKASFTLLS